MRCLAVSIWLLGTVLGWADEPVVPGASVSGSLEGRILIDALNCTGCHDIEGFEPVAPLTAPRFHQSLAGKYSLKDLTRWLADPHEIKPGTRMPDLFGDSEQAESEALAISHFLLSLPPNPPSEIFPRGNVETGRELYHSIGCVACHEPEAGVNGTKASDNKSPSVLIRLAKFWSTDALAEYLRNPASAGMPDFGLSLQEAADLAAYLHRDVEPQVEPFRPRNSRMVARGMGIFKTRGCAKCHGNPPGVLAMGGKIRRKLTRPQVEQGCLADEPDGRAPNFHLSATQRDAIREAIVAGEDAEVDRVAHTLQTLNCTACHARDGLGGAEAGRVAHFGISDERALSLGDSARVPPKLDGVGRKLTSAAMARALRGEIEPDLRPAMETRMPRYEHPAVRKLGDWFEAADLDPDQETWQPPGSGDAAALAAGRKLMGPDGLGCMACHGLGETPAAATPSIDLDGIAKRLRPNYFRDLLMNPLEVEPGTSMPPVFQDRPQAETEIGQIWHYLIQEGS